MHPEAPSRDELEITRVLNWTALRAYTGAVGVAAAFARAVPPMSRSADIELPPLTSRLSQ